MAKGTTILVLDSSIIAKWFIDEEKSQQARKIYHEAQKTGTTIYAPSLAHYEIGNVLLKKKMPAIHAHFILQTLTESPIIWIDMTMQITKRTYDIAQMYEMTYYDAVFIACAESVGGKLVTANIKHQGKYSGKATIQAL